MYEKKNDLKININYLIERIEKQDVCIREELRRKIYIILLCIG
jgi:hypothetical protein